MEGEEDLLNRLESLTTKIAKQPTNMSSAKFQDIDYASMPSKARAEQH